MGINGNKGRAKFLANAKRWLLREAAAAGVDITDRAAVIKFKHERLNRIGEAIKARSAPNHTCG